MHSTRRDFVEVAARALTLPSAIGFFSAWLSADEQHRHGPGSTAPPEPGMLAQYNPKFFDASDFEALRSFTEILIPTDNTPGAREAHCAHFIDFVLDSAADDAAMQESWRDALTALRAAGFHSADSSRRQALVEEISRPERERSASHPAHSAYLLIKRENAFAFFTSRAGMIETLDYKGNSYNVEFPACTHPEHRVL